MSNKTSASKLLEQSLKLSLKNIWRNKVLSLTTIFVTAMIIFIFNIILIINFITQDALVDLNQKIDIIVYLKESTKMNNIQDIAEELKIQEGVVSVTYTSKEKALSELTITHPDISKAFEAYKLDNPLPASLNITTSHPKYHETISEFLSQTKYSTFLSNIKSKTEENNNIISKVSENLIQITSFTEQVIFWLIITFILGGSLIILNALQITIFTRKKEISIMKLVGASNWFIKSPFIIEAIIYASLAVIFSAIMLKTLEKNIIISNTELGNLYYSINFYKIFTAEALITITFSIISSIIAINEYTQRDLQ